MGRHQKEGERMNKPCLPQTYEQSIVAEAIYKTYGMTHVEHDPTEEDPSLTISAKFWGDSYSGYNITVTIEPDGHIREEN